MSISRANVVSVATIAALAGLTGAALASNANSSKPAPVAANTTPIVIHKTKVVHRTIRRTKTIEPDGTVVITVQGKKQRAKHPKSSTSSTRGAGAPAARSSAPALLASAPAQAPVSAPSTVSAPATVQRKATAPATRPVGRDDDEREREQERDDDHGGERDAGQEDD